MTTQRFGCSEFELVLEWKDSLKGQIDIDYAQDAAGEYHAILRLSPDGVRMVLHTPAGEQELKHDPHVPGGRVVFLRRGNYARALYDVRNRVYFPFYLVTVEVPGCTVLLRTSLGWGTCRLVTVDRAEVLCISGQPRTPINRERTA